MTRQECEQRILDKLEEIRDVVKEYDPKLNGCCLGFTKSMVYVFKFDENENLVLDSQRFEEEEQKDVERMAG